MKSFTKSIAFTGKNNMEIPVLMLNDGEKYSFFDGVKTQVTFFDGNLKSADVSIDGRLACICTDTAIYVFDIYKGAIVFKIEDDFRWADCIFQNDTKYLYIVCANENCTIKVVDIPNKTMVQEIEIESNDDYSIALSEQNNFIVLRTVDDYGSSCSVLLNLKSSQVKRIQNAYVHIYDEEDNLLICSDPQNKPLFTLKSDGTEGNEEWEEYIFDLNQNNIRNINKDFFVCAHSFYSKYTLSIKTQSRFKT